MKKVMMDKAMERALKNAINAKLEDTCIKVYGDGGELGRETIVWSVNWSALGDVCAERTRKMADDLKKAADIVDFLNEQNICFTYEENPVVQKTLEAGDIDGARNIIECASGVYEYILDIKDGRLMDFLRADFLRMEEGEQR